MFRVIILLTLFIPAFPALVSAKNCKTGFNSCAERDAWREDQITGENAYETTADPFNDRWHGKRDVVCYWEKGKKHVFDVNDMHTFELPAAPTDCNTMRDEEYCKAKWAYYSINEIYKNGNRTHSSDYYKLLDSRRSFVRYLRTASQAVTVRLYFDFIATENFLDLNQVPARISMPQLDAAVEAFAEHTRKAAAGFPTDVYGKKRKGWFNDNVADGLVKDYSSKQKFKDILERNEAGVPRSPEERYRFLMDRAKTMDNRDFADGLTPYYARMILTFNGANDVTRRDPAHAAGQLNLLAHNLSLKVNVGEKEKPSWDNVILHDGYVYGADPREARRLLDTDLTGDGSMGIDCSLLMQKGLQHYGYSGKNFSSDEKSPQRVTTGALLNNGSVSDFNKRQICSEKELQIGSVVVKNGHTYIFAGYQQGHPTKLRVIEASGNEHRTVRDSELDLYPNSQDCRTSVFTDPKTPHYVLLPKKAPIK